MKVLFISLLRLGDTIMLSASIRQFRRVHPEAQIDLLVNSEFVDVQKIMPEVDNVISFDRFGLQESLAEYNCSAFESFEYLNEIVSDLNARSYTKIINVTHNKLSAYLTSLLACDVKEGAYFNENMQPQFSSPWFRYLNNYTEGANPFVFHYTDVIVNALGLTVPTQNQLPAQVETDEVRAEVSRLLTASGYNSGKKIIVQIKTSDAKKNVSLEKWLQIIAKMHMLHADAQFFLSGSSQDRADLELMRAKLLERKISSHLAILSLAGLYSLMNYCDLLITGDTSVKHLAALSEIPIFEVCIGSSDYRRTGAYKSGTLILRSIAACSPCAQSQSCTQISHICEGQISADYIALSASKFLMHDFSGLRVVAEEYADQGELLLTTITPNKIWEARPLYQSNIASILTTYLEKSAWRFYLEREHLKSFAGYGMESFKIKNGIEDIIAQYGDQCIRVALSQIESITLDCESRINKVLSTLTQKIKLDGGLTNHFFLDDELRLEINAIEKQIGYKSQLSQDMTVSQQNDFYNFRKLQIRLNETFSQQQIKLKLIRNLVSQLTERI